MIKLITMFLFLISPCVSWAEISFEEVKINGRSALLSSDGSWHYADDGGPICQEIEGQVNVCLDHSYWHPFPNADLFELGDGIILFRNGTVNIASLTVWTEDELKKLEQLRKFDLALDEARMKQLIANSAQNDGLNALVIGRSNTEVSGKPAKTIVTIAGTVKAFTYVLQDDLALLLEISFPNTTLFTKDKQMLHQKLVDSIVIKDQ